MQVDSSESAAKSSGANPVSDGVRRCESDLSSVAGGPLSVGIAVGDITPEEPAYLTGFGARKDISVGVHRRLTATCVVFDNTATRLAFLALDILNTREQQILDLREAAGQAGIPPQHLMVNFSHTHYGPGIGGERNASYTSLFKVRTDPLFQAAVDDLKPAALDYTVGSSTMGINRRQIGADGKIGFRPEPRKQIDPDVPVLRVLSPEGEVRAVIFGYACHPTTIGKDEWHLVNTDYPGHARDFVAAAYPGCTPVFLQGCGADIKPRYTRPMEDGYGVYNYVHLNAFKMVAEVGHELGRAVVSALMVPPERVPVDRSAELPGAVEEPIQLGGIVEKTDIPHRDPERTENWITMGAWRLGDVYIFGSQCEVGSKLGLRIKKELAGTRAWTNGYTHWGGGYFIDSASYPEGGYEVTSGVVSAAGEDIMVSNAHRYVSALKEARTGLGPIVEPPAD